MSRKNPRFHRNNPALPAAPNSTTVLLELQGQIESQMTISTFTYNTPSVLVTQAQLLGLSAAFHTALGPKLLACMSADWVWSLVKVIPLPPITTGPVVDTGAAGAPGTLAAGHEPTTVATVLSRYTATAGQHGRGRVSLPAVPTAMVTNSTITGATLSANLNTLATAMLGTLSDGTNTWTPGICTRSVTPPHPVLGFGPLTQVTPRLLLGTVRRRKIGRGK